MTVHHRSLSSSVPRGSATEASPRSHRRPVLVRPDVDNSVRWRSGERLEHYFEQRCDELPPGHLAVITDDVALTFGELDARANQTARYLRDRGITPGDRIGVLFDKSIHGYVALLAILKAGAAYVPLDPGFPADRIAFILDDAGIGTVLSVSAFAAKLDTFPVECIHLDAVAEAVEARSAVRLSAEEDLSTPGDELFYIIYTSGTTGRPKGVAIEHAGICNFVKVAGELYGYRPDDRCYQGMTLAFDFHVEDLWTPLIAGATVIAGKSGVSLFGADLHAYLTEKKVTVFPCVPTLWATIDDDLPDVRIIQLSGEAVPHHLVVRWHRPGRQILNAYGPTECSVSSTLRVLSPDSPVTVGIPLPTYTVVILDEHRPAEVTGDAIGEIGIAGPCLARGYLNREELTQEKFIPDFLGLPNNPSQRIYRTGDYGRIGEHGELEFHGRIDTQVKLRGYRIELGEIEAVLAEVPGIGHVVVNPYETEPGTTDLVAYYTRERGTSGPEPDATAEALRSRLPAYMIPGYLEELPAIPMTGNNKADRRALPAPQGPRFSSSTGNATAPRTDMEIALAEVLMDVMTLDRVSIDDNFFQDLGAHSLLMAKFGAGIRQRLDLSAVSMRDIYLNPSIEELAAHVESLAAEDTQEAVATSNREGFHVPSNADYWRCGVLQLGWYLGWAMLYLWLLVTGITWTYSAMPDLGATYVRLVVFALGTFSGLSLLSVGVKWTFVGRWKPEAIPIWSMRYFRFWAVKFAVRSAPMALVGGPLRNLYLRLLGARIGANTVIQASAIPVTTDLVSIGSGTILEKESIVQGYKARSNHIYTGPIVIGSDAFVGEASIVDIHCVMEDGTQLGFASSLHEGQRIPAGKRFHGTPAAETEADYCDIDPLDCTPLRRWSYALVLLVVGIGAAAVPMVVVYSAFPHIWAYVWNVETIVIAHDIELLWTICRMVVGSLVAYVAALILGLLVIAVVPRVLNLFLRPGRAYVLYGFHYFLEQMISGISNSVFYNRLFGDSSAIVHYERWVGYELNTVVQTGSNFGLSQRHENPFLVDIGSGTMISGGIKVINETMSSSAFKVGRVRIGERNYLGNYVHIPPESKLGDNCLLATKALAPIEGPVRKDIGLLGSPAFEIPRATARDLEMSRVDEDARRNLLQAKNRYNLVTALLFLFSNWFLVFLQATSTLVAIALFPLFGLAGVFVTGGVSFVVSLLWMWLVERGVLRFGSLRPRVVPLLDRYFWFHERTWKLTGLWFIAPMFAGTPFKNWFSRMEGVRLGAKVFDDGAYFDEYTLIEVGDMANLNSHCVMQPHSLEERVFKSGRITLGEGATLGCAANLHYDIVLGDYVSVEQNAFVMKGEVLDEDTTWRGNPARSLGRSPSRAH
jgi:non-ribosomal peptide synthetase-like protein